MPHCIFLVSDYFVCLNSSGRVTLLSSTSYSPTPSSTSTGDGGCLCSYLVIEGVEPLGQGAVHVEPPVADEVLLVEDGPVGAEEGVGDQVAINVSQGTEVECLLVKVS